MPEESFDDSSMLIRFMKSQRRKSGFKFCNHWAQKENFIDTVESILCQDVQGHKRLKTILRDTFHRVPVQQALEHAEA